MTEDDTFTALKRIPLPQMIEIISRAVFEASRDLNALFIRHGWTETTYIIELWKTLNQKHEQHS